MYAAARSSDRKRDYLIRRPRSNQLMLQQNRTQGL